MKSFKSTMYGIRDILLPNTIEKKSHEQQNVLSEAELQKPYPYSSVAATEIMSSIVAKEDVMAEMRTKA